MLPLTTPFAELAAKRVGPPATPGASIALFEGLGFELVKRVPVFGEVVYELRRGAREDAGGDRAGEEWQKCIGATTSTRAARTTAIDVGKGAEL